MADRIVYPLNPAANAAAVDQVLAELRRRMLAGRWTAEFGQDPPDEDSGESRTLRCLIKVDEEPRVRPSVVMMPADQIVVGEKGEAYLKNAVPAAIPRR